MSLGETIYRLRTERNMSQGDLAEALEVSRQSISKWETGGSVPELDKLTKMGELFGVSMDELILGKKEEKEETPLLTPGDLGTTLFPDDFHQGGRASHVQL